MLAKSPSRSLLLLLLLPACAAAAQTPPSASPTAPTPEIFAPGIISGPGNDGSPTFSPDGSTLYFTRSAAHWSVILESHRADGAWSKPTLAPFSGEWPDSSPAMAPDGAYLIFQSTRPAAPLTARPEPGKPIPGIVSNLWRVDRVGSGWSEPKRLPDSVNISHSIWKPSVAADGTLYFTEIDQKGNKRLYSTRPLDGAYQLAQPLPFSDGTTLDVDPEIAPDGSFLVFSSAGRLKDDSKDHLYIVRWNGTQWGEVTSLRYAGDNKPYCFSTDDEPHLGPDHHTLYFSSDRAVATHFPRTRQQAQQDLDRLEQWDNSNSNVWSIPIP